MLITEWGSIASAVSALVATGTFIFFYTKERKTRRIQVFYDFYKHWNSEFMQSQRHELNTKVFLSKRETYPNEQISIYDLRDKEPDKHAIFETVYDFFNDMAVLYSNNLIDKTLVKLLMGGFVERYYERLTLYYRFADDEKNPKAKEVMRVYPKLSRKFYLAFQQMHDDICVK